MKKIILKQEKFYKFYDIFYEFIGKNLSIFYFKDFDKWILEIHTENLEVIEIKFDKKSKVKKYLKNRNFFAEDLKEINGVKKIKFRKEV